MKNIKLLFSIGLFLFFGSESFGQLGVMFRVKYKNAADLHYQKTSNDSVRIPGPDYTTNDSLNDLLNSYNVRYYAV